MIRVLGKPKTTEELQALPLLRPEKAGSRWQGIGHYQLATTIESALKRRDIHIEQETWAVDQSGQTLVGGLNVDFPSRYGVPNLPQMHYSLGIRHSNALKHALTFAVGAQITICTNGLCTGTFVLCRKHTNGLSLVNEVESGIARFIEQAQGVQKCIELLKTKELTQTETDHRLMEAGRRKLLAWSHIGMVQEEYAKPSFTEFEQQTGWGLMNAFTYIAQRANPLRQLHAINAFRDIVLN